MRTTRASKYRDGIRELVKLPDDVFILSAQSNWSLYYGFVGDDDYPGFDEATKILRNATDHIGDLWACDWSGYVMDHEPEGYLLEGEDGEEEWIEPEWDEYIHLSRSDILRELLGEVSSYL